MLLGSVGAVSTYLRKMPISRQLNRMLCANSNRYDSSRDETFVISTTSRGIGLQFAIELLENTHSSTSVIGLCRNESESMTALKLKYPNRFHSVSVDLEDQGSITSAAEEVKSISKKVDLLINCAAILGDGTSVPGPERSIEGIDRDWLKKSLEVSF